MLKISLILLTIFLPNISYAELVYPWVHGDFHHFTYGRVDALGNEKKMDYNGLTHIAYYTDKEIYRGIFVAPDFDLQWFNYNLFINGVKQNESWLNDQSGHRWYDLYQNLYYNAMVDYVNGNSVSFSFSPFGWYPGINIYLRVPPSFFNCDASMSGEWNIQHKEEKEGGAMVVISDGIFEVRPTIPIGNTADGIGQHAMDGSTFEKGKGWADEDHPYANVCDDDVTNILCSDIPDGQEKKGRTIPESGCGFIGISKMIHQYTGKTPDMYLLHKTILENEGFNPYGEPDFLGDGISVSVRKYLNMDTNDTFCFRKIEKNWDSVETELCNSGRFVICPIKGQYGWHFDLIDGPRTEDNPDGTVLETAYGYHREMPVCKDRNNNIISCLDISHEPIVGTPEDQLLGCYVIETEDCPVYPDEPTTCGGN